MQTIEASGVNVLRLFGRPPMPEDWRAVGRWSYAAAWLAEDRAVACDLARARYAGACAPAISAALGAGRSAGERFALVSALARAQAAFEDGRGPLGAAAQRAVGIEAERLVRQGATLRSALLGERAAFASRWSMEPFVAAMLDTGQERHVLLREAAAGLEDALLGIRSGVPALRCLRSFLQATLASDGVASSAAIHIPLNGEADEASVSLARLLATDLALLSRKGAAYASAWAEVANASGDALAVTMAGLASGRLPSEEAVAALRDDPFALLLALAVTVEPPHANALLETAALSQTIARKEAERRHEQLRKEIRLTDSLERDLETSVAGVTDIRIVSAEWEEGGRNDLFVSWEQSRAASEAIERLRSARARSVELRRVELEEDARKAAEGLDAALQASQLASESKSDVGDGEEFERAEREEAGAQRGCFYGFGAGCSVMALYLLIAIVVGTGGFVGRIAPVVVAGATLPIGAALLLQISLAARRCVAKAEAQRRATAIAKAESKRRLLAEERHAPLVMGARERVRAAESRLAAFESGLESLRACDR